jgi:hypothetical protein
MDFSTKLAQTREYATLNQLGVDSQEVYNEGILQALDNINNSTNGGVLLDTFATQVLTTSFVALPNNICKYVTLINLTTNAKFTYRIMGIVLTLEAGYSVRLNVLNASSIGIAQTTGEGNTAQIIITQ